MDLSKEVERRGHRAFAGGTSVGYFDPLGHTASELVRGTLLTLSEAGARKGRFPLHLAGPALLALGGSAIWALASRYRLTGMAALGLVGGLVVYRGLRGGRPAAEKGITELTESVTVGRAVHEVERQWRDPEIQERIMQPFATVTPREGNRLRWWMDAFARGLEWETTIVEDRPGELLRWQSLPNSKVANEGSVHFRPAPGGRGTEVTLRFRFDPRGDLVAKAVQKLLETGGNLLLLRALRRFKSLIETGEIPTLAHQPAARAEPG